MTGPDEPEDDDDRDRDDGPEEQHADSLTNYEQGIADILDGVMNQDGEDED